MELSFYENKRSMKIMGKHVSTKNIIREVRNISILSVMTIIIMQAITNADLIKLYVSEWIYGTEQIITPQTSFYSTTQQNKAPTIEPDHIKKLIATTTNTQKKIALAPTIEQSLAEKKNYKVAFNTLPPINKLSIEKL